MNEQEVLNCMALTQVPHLTLANMRELHQRLGSATAVMEHRHDIGGVTEASPRLAAALKDVAEPLHKAECELRWAQDNGVRPVVMGDPAYPQRLTECPDAPLVLYTKGDMDLNRQRVISIVGTRHSTTYGQDILRRLMADLRLRCPDLLVVSGLAYGIDVCAHREALRNGIPTVAVVAHGLDLIYPNSHRGTAQEMMRGGGLVTEYMSQTTITKGNFVQRNRIVAGLADCTILVESGEKGGGLITMGIARDYNRDTFAFPGPVSAERSKGCNNLIRDNMAALISNADDLLKAMNWTSEEELEHAKRQGIERQVFPELTEEEKLVVSVLQKTNDLQINILTVRTGLAVARLSALLFSLEMKGVTKAMAGGTYHLLL